MGIKTCLFYLKYLCPVKRDYFQLENWDPGLPKEYEAELWTKESETITFAVRFNTGSHMSVTFVAESEGEVCTDVNAAPCVFPFRSDGIMYYGCTNGSATPQCATDVDTDFNPKSPLTDCDPLCHVQGNYV